MELEDGAHTIFLNACGTMDDVSPNGERPDARARQSFYKIGVQMRCMRRYHSPLGEILLASDGEAITGLWFEGQKHFVRGLKTEHEEKNVPVIERTAQWLDDYFSGQEPDFTPPLHMTGTDFQMKVWRLLLKIPYGETVTYGELAREVAAPGGRASAQAVGGALSRNAISIIVPCHRVVGADGSLTGYAGGLDKKAKLLALEKTLRPF